MVAKLLVTNAQYQRARTAGRAYANQFGFPAAQEALRRYSAEKISELCWEDLGSFTRGCESAVAEHQDGCAEFASWGV